LEESESQTSRYLVDLLLLLDVEKKDSVSIIENVHSLATLTTDKMSQDFFYSMTSGETVLVDAGQNSIKTGVYYLDGDGTLVRIHFPFPEERYEIKRGPFAGTFHTIKASTSQERLQSFRT
jgi:hypothetical protein